MTARNGALLSGIGALLIVVNVALRPDILGETAGNPRLMLVLVGFLYLFLGGLRQFTDDGSIRASVLVTIVSLLLLEGVAIGLLYVGDLNPALTWVEYAEARTEQVLVIAPISMAYPLGVVHMTVTGPNRIRYTMGIVGVAVLLLLSPFLLSFAVGGRPGELFAFVLLYLAFVDIALGLPLYLESRYQIDLGTVRTVILRRAG